MQRSGIFTLILLLFAIALPSTAKAQSISAKDVCVLDGDTIRLHKRKPDFRLVGFNAPETDKAECDLERDLGNKATARLKQLVNTSQLEFREVVCSCKPGTHGTKYCNHKRKCGTLLANGRDVGDILMAEKLAESFKCGPTKCPETPKPWCEGQVQTPPRSPRRKC